MSCTIPAASTCDVSEQTRLKTAGTKTTKSRKITLHSSHSTGGKRNKAESNAQQIHCKHNEAKHSLTNDGFVGLRRDDLARTEHQFEGLSSRHVRLRHVQVHFIAAQREHGTKNETESSKKKKPTKRKTNCRIAEHNNRRNGQHFRQRIHDDNALRQNKQRPTAVNSRPRATRIQWQADSKPHSTMFWPVP